VARARMSALLTAAGVVSRVSATFGEHRPLAHGSRLVPKLGLTKINMCSELVGMAGFEPAASCSQIRSIGSPGVVRCSSTWR
jgi:hypothetical protein